MFSEGGDFEVGLVPGARCHTLYYYEHSTRHVQLGSSAIHVTSTAISIHTSLESGCNGWLPCLAIIKYEALLDFRFPHSSQPSHLPDSNAVLFPVSDFVLRSKQRAPLLPIVLARDVAEGHRSLAGS